MSKEDLERIDDRLMEVWNSHNADEWVALFADRFVWHDWTVPEPITDKSGARAYFESWMTAFPDMNAKTTNRVVSDDAVAAELEFHGTNSGPLSMGGMELPPTDRSVVGRGSYFLRAENGKVVEFSSHPDAAGMMMQLGLMPQ